MYVSKPGKYYLSRLMDQGIRFWWRSIAFIYDGDAFLNLLAMKLEKPRLEASLLV